jgi:hypothetical protein
MNRDHWIKQVKEELRPHYPIRFKSVHAVSAKLGQLGNLREKLKELYLKRHPPQRPAKFEEDFYASPRKQRLLI